MKGPESALIQLVRSHGIETAQYELKAAEAEARDLFDADQQPPIYPAPKSRFPIVRLLPLDHSKIEPELVESWFGLSEFLRLNGPPGCGKTTVAVWIGVHVAAGISWYGKGVLRGAVLFIELEGERNLRLRVEATCSDMNLVLAHQPIYMMSENISLFLESEWRELLKTILEFMGSLTEPLRLIVIDTQSRATAGAEENSATDAAKVIRALDEIRLRTGAAVMLLHHLPHDGDRARGSTGYLGAVDCELIATRDGAGLGTIRCVKMRNRAEPECIKYRLKSVPVGFGPKGEIITGAVAFQADAEVSSENGPKQGSHAADLLQIISARSCQLSVDRARRNFLARYTGQSVASGRTAFNRALKNLLDSGLIVRDGDNLLPAGAVPRRMLDDSLDALIQDRADYAIN